MPNDRLVQTGIISLQFLYQGSKSEGMYPVFESDDGSSALVRVKGQQFNPCLDPLSIFYNQKIRIIGDLDYKMGHLRLTLHLKGQIIEGIELIALDPEPKD